MSAPTPLPLEEPSYFPLFLSLTGEKALVVGGGADAVPKVEMLLRAGARVTVAAKRLCRDLEELAAAGRIEHHAGAFAAAALDGARLCIAAFEDEGTACAAMREARRRGILFNAIDRKELCDFIVPAMVERGPVQIAISTGGLAPALARDLRARIEAAVPAAYAKLARFCGRWRRAVTDALPKVARRRFWDAVLDGPEAQAALANDPATADRLIADRLAGIRSRASLSRGGRVSLVGAGPGDPELLTLRAERLIRRADVILYDKLVAPEILALARRDARRIDVGKRCGRHAMSQGAINRLLVEHARRGAHVVRLKGGDPFIFGRGGEELECLRAAGVPVDIVPGITAAVAAAARLGVPLTHRGVSRALHLVTGHGRDGEEVELDWPALARPGATLAIYMGARTLPRIARRLAEAGLPAETPAVAIENATREGERVCRGTLGDIAGRVAGGDCSGPTLVIIGRVAALRAPEEAAIGRDDDAREARAAA
jgi:uroporphyrin-III C-methyltransferase/precorrin-2 dehydrogenase/sirohydrochlorin ferrochelatase